MASSMSMSMSMPMTMTMTMTGSAAAASSTGASMGGMGGMSGMGGMGGGCKISMLWNWYTIDACFLARSWRITSKGVFAGSCIGVILLVRSHVARQTSTAIRSGSETASDASLNKGAVATGAPASSSAPLIKPFHPNVLQQAVRALLHMLQFAVAYFIMLLAMYYNGYIIICIFIGAFLGFFIFGWKSLGGSTPAQQREVTFCCG